MPINIMALREEARARNREKINRQQEAKTKCCRVCYVGGIIVAPNVLLLLLLVLLVIVPQWPMEAVCNIKNVDITDTYCSHRVNCQCSQQCNFPVYGLCDDLELMNSTGICCGECCYDYGDRCPVHYFEKCRAVYGFCYKISVLYQLRGQSYEFKTSDFSLERNLNYFLVNASNSEIPCWYRRDSIEHVSWTKLSHTQSSRVAVAFCCISSMVLCVVLACIVFDTKVWCDTMNVPLELEDANNEIEMNREMNQQ